MEMGESDDESQGFASPNISPMNVVVGQTAPRPQKQFIFNNTPIQEELHEEDSVTPVKKTTSSRQVEDLIEKSVEELVDVEFESGFKSVKLVVDSYGGESSVQSSFDYSENSDIEFEDNDLPGLG